MSDTSENTPPKPFARLKSLKAKLILMAASVVVFFGGAEIALRLSGFEFTPIRYVDPTRRQFGFMPNYRGPGTSFAEVEQHYNIRINSHGFRGPHIPKRKHKKVFRIIALGDSCTFGQGLEEEMTYPAKLQRKLNERSPKRRFEVINAGVIGYSSFYGLKYLELRLLDFHPDLVIVYFGWNDLWFHTLTDKRNWELEDELVRRQLNRFLFSRSRLYQFLTKSLLSFKYKVGFHGSSMSARRKRKVPIDDYRDNLETMIRLANDKGFQIMLMTAPSAVDPDITAKEWWVETSQGSMSEVAELNAQYNDVVRDVAAKNKAPLVDCARIFEKKMALSARDKERMEKEGEKKYLPSDLFFPDGIHPKGKGNQIIAEAIAEAVRIEDEKVRKWENEKMGKWETGKVRK